MNQEFPNRSVLNQRNILLGVSGGIACYKSAELVRRLKDYGADVRVVMTSGAEAFVSTLTFQALSGNPVHTELLDDKAEAGMGHIELAKWADLILIAPATANFIERLAQGRGDDLLSTLCLATTAPVQVAPAMNQAMWSNTATQKNIERLKNLKIGVLGPGSGSQACGDVGSGRMLEPLEIVDLACGAFDKGILTGKKVVITAGPTRETIDPVRYLSNHSSGKMGYSLAAAAATAGAETILISGPVALETPARVTRVDVESAEQMMDAVMAEIEDTGLFIAAAAVADYRAANIAEQKIKKTEEHLTLELIKNPDILNTVGLLENKPFTVGFAAESEKLREHAQSKLQRKNLDLIIANDISRSDIGFGHDENEVLLITENSERALPKTSKQLLGKQLISDICDLWLKT